MLTELEASWSRSAESLSLISVHYGGHRKQYVDMFSSLSRDAGGECRVSSRWTSTILDPNPVLFLMIEDGTVGYFVSAIFRSLTKRKTVGLLFQGSEAARASTKRRRLKRLMLQFIRNLPGVSTLSITPFIVAPELSAVATGWIHDPQLWDFAHGVPQVSSALAEEVIRRANGRRIVVALGDQKMIKGFHYFCDLWTERPELRKDFFFVSAGRVDAAAMDVAAAFVAAEGFMADRLLTDEELYSLYNISDIVWGCYAPTYDQASGIIGRAVQWGRTVVVREHSQMSRLLKHTGAPLIALPWNQPDAAIGAFASIPAVGMRPEEIAREFRCRSLIVLGEALDLMNWCKLADSVSPVVPRDEAT